MQKVDVYLFGSRTDESKVGGDIDLALDIDISREEFRRKKAQFLAILIRQEFDIKMDIVQYNLRKINFYTKKSPTIVFKFNERDAPFNEEGRVICI